MDLYQVPGNHFAHCWFLKSLLKCSAREKHLTSKCKRNSPNPPHPVAVTSNWRRTSSEFINSAQEFPTPLVSTGLGKKYLLLYWFVSGCTETLLQLQFFCMEAWTSHIPLPMSVSQGLHLSVSQSSVETPPVHSQSGCCAYSVSRCYIDFALENKPLVWSCRVLCFTLKMPVGNCCWAAKGSTAPQPPPFFFFFSLFKRWWLP